MNDSKQNILEIKPGVLFRLIFFGYLGFGIPIGILFALLTLFEIMPVNFNGNETYGISGFAFQAIFVPLFSGLLAIPTWITIFFGLKVYNFIINAFKKS